MNATEPIQTVKEKPRYVWGTILIIVGLLLLAENFIPAFHFSDYWPIILIVIGLGLILRSTRRSS